MDFLYFRPVENAEKTDEGRFSHPFHPVEIMTKEAALSSEVHPHNMSQPLYRGFTMPIPHSKSLTVNAKRLRREMTPEEKTLWYQYLKTFPYTVHRQKVILNYIVDFYIHSHKIVIELDGRQHLTAENKAEDEKRDQELAELGITVLRYPNRMIHHDFYMVCVDIGKHCGLYPDA